MYPELFHAMNQDRIHGKRRLRGLYIVSSILLVAFGLLGQAAPPLATAPGHPTLLSPHSDPIAVHQGKVFVVNTPADTLDVIDTTTEQVVTRIPTGVDPVSVSVRPDGQEVWVSNHISDSVSVIDNDPESATYLSVIATVQDIDLAKKSTRFNEPVGIAFANNAKAYVALSSSNQIAAVDVASRKVTKHLKIRAQEPRAIAVINDKLYVLPFESNNQTQLSGGKEEDIDGELVTFDAQKLAGAFDSAGFTVDVVKNAKIPDRDLYIFDIETDELLETVNSLGTNLFGLAVDDSDNVFIANTDARNHINGKAGTKNHGLAELDNRPYLNRVTRVAADRKPTFHHLNPMPPEQPNRRQAVATPFGIKVSEDGRHLYLTGASSDHVIKLDAESGEILGRVKVGAVPRGIALQESANLAWIFNAAGNTVSKVNTDTFTVANTIALSDPTPPIFKEGRIAFNTARASSNGTFSCASCHADGHTDQLLWVLDTPHIVGADQIEPRLSQTLRGLRGTAPYHWDGVPGDPYGGQNASTRERLEPNSDINKPESSVRHVIDGGMASTMLEHGSEIENDEGKKGYLSKAERDAMAIFLLNLSHMPTPGRAYTDELSQDALTGFERFHVTGARDTNALNTNVCGSCHTFPYLATDQNSMNVPSFRGALDRFITQAQARNSVIDLGGVMNVAEEGWPEEEVWRRMLNMGEHKRLWPVLDMFKESSMGFSGAFGRQATLSKDTVNDPVTRDLLDALETSAREESTILKVSARFIATRSVSEANRNIDLHFTNGRYEQGEHSWTRDQLVQHAKEGSFIGTFTAYHGSDVVSPPPAIWTAGVLHKQRGAQLFPRVHAKQPSMVISALHIQESATLFIDGRKVSGTIVEASKDLIEIQFDTLPAKGMRMLQVQNPNSYLSNEFIFYVETPKEAIVRYQKEPDYLLTTILNSALINDHPKEARIVIEAGADLNMPHGKNHFDKERPPIIIASQYGRTEIVRELLAHGADPNIRTKDGDTALHRAAHMGRFDICQILLNAGANPNALNKKDKRPIDLTNHFIRKGNFEKYHQPWNVNLTLDHDRYTRERPQVRELLESVATVKRPNVITLLVDDLGYRDLGCYGGPVKTPVLDKLAAGGVRFTDFHSGAPTCSPSRATFLTGRHHYRTGVYSVINESVHKMHLLPGETTIAEVLKENGYGTAHFGKWHLGMLMDKRKNPTPADHGFDYWFGLINGVHPNHKDPTNFLRNGEPVGPMKGYSCQLVVDEALTWLDEKRAPDEPFFLNLWFNEPHAVIAAPDEIVSQYGALDDQAAIYNGTIDNTDRAIGRLVAKLKELGELDNTIIVYSSDNGSYRQERSGELRGKKGSQFEGGHRVPGIFYWKDGIPGGRVENEPAGAVDLLPTLCGLIGIGKPGGVDLDGSDLAPLLTRSGKFKRHRPLFWMSQASMVMRMGDHTLFNSGTAKSPIDFKAADRLIKQVEEALGDDLEKELGGLDLRSRMFNGRFANPEANRLQKQHRELYYFNEASIPELKKSGVGRVQLYDLSKDLGQQNDIAKERPELVAQLKEQAAAIYRSVMADAPEWLTPEELVAAKKPQENTPDRPAPGASDTATAALLARIDKNPLPKVYHGSRHQAYVDKVMASLKPEQRARVGLLWKEKRRFDPDMPNRGASFIRILTHVAGGA
jgi:YVTN family beta-propeller protein